MRSAKVETVNDKKQTMAGNNNELYDDFNRRPASQ